MADPLILEALAYRRHVGASLGQIRSYVGARDQARQPLNGLIATLRGLEAAGTLVKVGKRWFLTSKGRALAKGASLEPEWRGEDAWILLALLYDREKAGARLADVIGTADYIDHAIPSREEIHGALNRLLAGRLVVRRRDRFFVTEKARDLFAKVESSCKKSVQDQLDGLTRLMACPCCGVKLKGVRWRFILDEATYRTGALEVSSPARSRPSARPMRRAARRSPGRS